VWQWNTLGVATNTRLGSKGFLGSDHSSLLLASFLCKQENFYRVCQRVQTGAILYPLKNQYFTCSKLQETAGNSYFAEKNATLMASKFDCIKIRPIDTKINLER